MDLHQQLPNTCQICINTSVHTIWPTYSSLHWNRLAIHTIECARARDLHVTWTVYSGLQWNRPYQIWVYIEIGHAIESARVREQPANLKNQPQKSTSINEINLKKQGEHTYALMQSTRIAFLCNVHPFLWPS